MNQLSNSAVKHTPGVAFYIEFAEGKAALEYERVDDVLNVEHTYVPPTLRGTNVGKQLVLALIDYATKEDLLVNPHCSFVANFFKRHPEHDHLLS